MKYRSMPMTEDDTLYVEAAMDAYDDAVAPPEEGAFDACLVYKILGPNDVIIAGCVAQIDTWDVVNIDTLWVSKKYRKKGLGTALMREAEREAAEMGCNLSILGTFDFQAVEFYEKLGYTVVGMTEDWPKGHSNYMLCKRLGFSTNQPEDPLPFEIVMGEEEDAVYLGEKLADYNQSQVPITQEYQSFDTKLVDDAGAMMAACVAGIGGWQDGNIDMLWVEEDHRHRGLGTALLREAEREAKARGGALMLVEAFDWNVGFFLKNGYTVTGTIEDLPKGHTFYTMRKCL